MTNVSTRPTNKRRLNAKDWVPVQYLITLYSKDVLQGIFNEHLNAESLSVLVNALRRVNNGSLIRFGMEGAKTRVAALMDCVQGCVTKELNPECKDVYSNIFFFLFTTEEKDPALRLFTLKRWLKAKGINIKAVAPKTEMAETAINQTMASQLQEFFEDKKIEVVVELFEGILRSSKPNFTRVDVPELPVEDLVELASAE